MKRLRGRIAKLEETRPPANILPAPQLVSVYVDAAAPALNEGPIKWGLVAGVPGTFERTPEESEEDFTARLQRHLPDEEPSVGYSITLYAENRLPGMVRR